MLTLSKLILAKAPGINTPSYDNLTHFKIGVSWHHDTDYNDIQHNDTRHNDTQKNNKKRDH